MRRPLRYYIDLILILTLKELKIRYKNSLLGYIWSVLNPLLFSLIFYFSFKVVIKISIENYAFFLICGLFPWQWFANSISSSAYILLSNVSLIKKIIFPKELLPLTFVLNDAVHFLLSLPVIIGFAMFYGISFTPAWLYGTIFLTILQIFLCYGFSLLFSAINLFFRDLERLIGLLLTLIFYLTPIFYDPSFIPKKYQKFLYLNPFFLVIENWRGIFMKGTFNFSFYLIALCITLFIFATGLWVFKKLSLKFSEVL